MITELVARSFPDKAQLPQSLAESRKLPAASLMFPFVPLELIAFELDVLGRPMLAPVTLEQAVFLALKLN